MSSYVLLDVGCLECGEPTTVIDAYPTREEGEQALREIAAERYPTLRSHGVVGPDEVEDAGTAVLLAGSGGSYWYSLQLHEVGARSEPTTEGDA